MDCVGRALPTEPSPQSFSQAFAQAVKMLPPPWAYERRKGKNGWEYRFWREEPEKLTPEEFCRRECPAIHRRTARLAGKCRNGESPYEYPGCSSFDVYFNINRSKQEPKPEVKTIFTPHPKQEEAFYSTQQYKAISSPSAVHSCPADFIHKGAVRRRLIDMLLDPGAALDITLLNYVRELED